MVYFISTKSVANIMKNVYNPVSFNGRLKNTPTLK